MDKLTRAWGYTKPLRIAFNMLCCAVLFVWAGVAPRETISGLFGRKSCLEGRVTGFWVVGRKFIDRLHPDEAHHCLNTALDEYEIREVLYP